MPVESKKAKSSAERPRVLEVQRRADETGPQAAGRALVDPAINAACTMQPFQSFLGNDLSIMATIEEINRITKAVNGGDVSSLEAMLVSQTITLQTLFTSLTRRAQEQPYQKNLEAFLALGLKAQAQSRATIQALADLKYPRQIAFVKQANYAAGNQQVNNGPATPAEKSPAAQNKLLKVEDGKWLDPGATVAAKRDDQKLEALGKVYGPAKRGGKGEGGT